MPVVTLTGQRGSGVRPIGREVASLLGIDYVDREILAAAAKTLGAPLEEVMRHDEHLCSLKEKTARLLRAFLERSALAGVDDPFTGTYSMEVLLSRSYAEASEPASTRTQEVDDGRFYRAVTGAIRELGQAGNVVIHGRGVPVILRDLPRALHVFVVAEYEDRVRRVMGDEGLGRQEAERLMAASDRGRTGYFRKFFQVESDDPLLYHLTLNISRVSVEEGARLIAEMARALDSRPAPRTA